MQRERERERKRERERERERERDLSRLHAQCGLRRRAQSHDSRITTQPKSRVGSSTN